MLDVQILIAGAVALGRGDAEGAVEHLGDVGRPAILHLVDEDAPLGVFALAIEHLDPAPHVLEILRLGGDRQDAVQVFHGDQPHHARRLRARSVQQLVELGRDQAAVGALGNEQREAHAAQPVDIELLDQLANRAPLGRRAGDDQGVVRHVRLGDGVGHDRVEQLLQLLGVGVFQHQRLFAKTGVGGAEDAGPPLRRAERHDGVGPAPVFQRQVGGAQRLLEQRQDVSPGDRPGGLHRHDAVDRGVDRIGHAEDVAEHRLGDRLHIDRRKVERHVAPAGGRLPRRSRQGGRIARHDGGAHVGIEARNCDGRRRGPSRHGRQPSEAGHQRQRGERQARGLAKTCHSSLFPVWAAPALSPPPCSEAAPTASTWRASFF